MHPWPFNKGFPEVWGHELNRLISALIYSTSGYPGQLLTNSSAATHHQTGRSINSEQQTFLLSCGMSVHIHVCTRTYSTYCMWCHCILWIAVLHVVAQLSKSQTQFVLICIYFHLSFSWEVNTYSVAVLKGMLHTIYYAHEHVTTQTCDQIFRLTEGCVAWKSCDHVSTCLHSVKWQHMMHRADITSAGICDLRPVT